MSNTVRHLPLVDNIKLANLTSFRRSFSALRASRQAQQPSWTHGRAEGLRKRRTLAPVAAARDPAATRWL